MRLLASRRWRIFLTAWILFSVHFATNVVREHYPAFSIAEHGTFRVDEYQGFHADIFLHTDGHSYVGNNVIVSVLAAVPLFVFDPVLDALENHRLKQLAGSTAAPPAEYRTDKRLRRNFFRLVREKGLDLRFGAATVVTSAFFMAPFSALSVLLMYVVLVRRRVDTGRATWLALLFGVGTPVFFRTAHLNHNMFLMHALFLAFVLLWVRPGEEPAPLRHRIAAGLLGGFCLAADYIGVILLGMLYGYLLLSRLSTASWSRSIKESLPFVAASVPPVGFLFYSQWSMYGHPLYPGQYWMPLQNKFVTEGWRGFDWPTPDLLWSNLFDGRYGLYAFGPLLILALIPVFRYRQAELVLPRRERRFVVALFVAVLLFCAANQYSRLQWNTGFRYLVPLVPFLYLALCDHLVRVPRKALAVLSVAVIAHSWVLTVFREPVKESWRLFREEGVVLPWLRVFRMTTPEGTGIAHNPLLPWGVLGVTFLLILGLWGYGSRLETRRRRVGAHVGS
jgi:hypothetical protein